MYRCIHYLKVDGEYLKPGEISDLKKLDNSEVNRLLEQGSIEKSTETEKEKKPQIDSTAESDEEMSDEEVRALLLEKITHTIAVRELELLGAEFKKNASLESLVDLIMEDEDYEGHFLDYIDDNEL